MEYMPRILAAIGRRLQPVVIVQVAACFALLSHASAQSPPPAKGSPLDYERRCLAKIKGMTASHELTEWQSTRIEYLVREQGAMIDLFAKHGLLDEAELQKKIGTIQEVTRFSVDDIFTPDQLGIWWTWDLKLDAAEVVKPKPRERLLPAP